MRRIIPGAIAPLVATVALGYGWSREPTTQLQEVNRAAASTTAATTPSPTLTASSPPVPSLTPLSPASTPAPEDAAWVATVPLTTYEPLMPALTAQLALEVSPPLTTLYGSQPAGYPAAGWTEAQCDWITDSLFADYQLDRVNGEINNLEGLDIPQFLFYSGEVSEWDFMEGITTAACWKGGAIDPDQAAAAIKDAMGDGWNGHVVNDTSQTPGSSGDIWDHSWVDSYMEMAVMFAAVPGAPYYFAMDSGWGQTLASQETAADVLASLGVPGYGR